MDAPPLTLNPRSTLDASGQRINALIYRALTQVDHNLETRGDLAENWKSDRESKQWVFRVKSDLQPLFECLENYRTGKPTSPLLNGFPSWKSTELKKSRNEIIFHLDRPDPYLPKNVSLLRLFFTRDMKGHITPCREPGLNETIHGTGTYRPETPGLNPGQTLTLLPNQAGLSPLHFIFVREESSRILRFLKGEAHAVQNNISLSKTRWLIHKHGDQFKMIEREGVTVSYLTFNLKDPHLAKKKVRLAIAHAINRTHFIKNKMFGFGSIANSFLSPRLSEAWNGDFSFDPTLSEKLLEEAGYLKGPDGIRLKLKYKTTPVREGFEMALIFQQMLRDVGIELTLEVVEPAVHLASVRKGAYQLASSRWVGVADASILFRTLQSSQPDNRANYSSPKMDSLLTHAMLQSDLNTRVRLLQEAQELMLEDLPYFPLWFWHNALVLRKKVTGLSPDELSLSGGLVPLGKLRVGSPSL